MKYRIVAIGEVLWDLLPSGRQLGGAPANFACHAHVLGAEVRLATRVGLDALGREVLEHLRHLGLPLDTVRVDADAPTGTVSVELEADGQPRFTIHENVAWDRLTVDDPAQAAVAAADAVCFGSLAQRSESSQRAIQTLVAAARPDALRIFDVNLRPPFYTREVIERSLALANVLKLNDHELPLLAEMFDLPDGEKDRLVELARRHNLSLAVLTRGERGSLLYADGCWSDHPGLAVRVMDTVGAGDAFTAATALGFLAGWPLDEINQRANEVAAFVCTRPGATPDLPETLRQPFLRPQSAGA